jgi:hypothetical protein
MEVQPSGEVRGKANAIRERRSALRQMTPEQLLHLGAAYVAYLKAGICEGKALFVVYRADGIPVVVADDLDTAVESAAEQGLNFVAVH